jgi:hypothetical protein
MINKQNFRIVWNVLIALTATFTAVFYPYNLIYHVVENSYLILIDITVTILYLVDILMWELLERIWHQDNYFETFKDKSGKFRLELIPQVVAAIPFILVVNNHLFLLFRLMKLFKVAGMIHNLRYWAIRVSSQLTLLLFFFWLAILAHWLSCGWIMIRGLDNSLDNWTNYVNALFWAVTTLTTVGYGNQSAISNAQKLYTIFAELLGVVVYGYLIGNIVSLLAKHDPAKTHFLENMEKLSVLTKLRDIPANLEKRIRNYYIYTWKNKLGYNESEIISGLPAGLRKEVALQLKKEMIERIPLFKNTHESFMMDICLMLRPLIAIPGEYIIREKEEGSIMFFVLKGELSLIRNGKEYFKILRDGDFFGEMALFSNKSRNASVRAETYCDLYALEKNDFDYVMKKYPEFFSNIEKQALLRNETVDFIDNNT